MIYKKLYAHCMGADLELKHDHSLCLEESKDDDHDQEMYVFDLEALEQLVGLVREQELVEMRSDAGSIELPIGPKHDLQSALKVLEEKKMYIVNYRNDTFDKVIRIMLSEFSASQFVGRRRDDRTVYRVSLYTLNLDEMHVETNETCKDFYSSEERDKFLQENNIKHFEKIEDEE